jgi:hypothetical protein
MAKDRQNQSTDPHVLVTWVKEIRWLSGALLLSQPSDSPSGQAGWGLGTDNIRV